MSNNGHPTRWREVIGVEAESIRWAYVLAFAVALLVARYFPHILGAFVSPSSQVSHRYALFLLRLGFVWVFFAAGTVLVFRFIRREILGAFLVAAGMAVVNALVYLLFPSLSWGAPFGLAGWASSMASAFASPFLLLTGMVLALRWMRRWWLAVGVGAGVGSLLASSIGVLEFLFRMPWSTGKEFLRSQLTILPFDLVFAAVLAGVLWIGREMAQAQPGKISKRYYLGSIAGGIGLLVLLATALNTYARIQGGRSVAVLVALVAVALAALVWVAAAMLTLVYRMWNAIQDGHARATPGRAIGFMFIPVFNLYWAFQVFWGFARDYNGYLERHALRAKRLPSSLFLVYVILCFLAGIPVAGILVVTANIFVGSAMVARVCDAVNALPPLAVAEAHRSR